MFFKNAQLYRLPARWAMTAEQLEEALAGQAFAPAASNELTRMGWDKPRPAGGLVYALGGQFLLKLVTERKLLPATVVNQAAAARAAELEEEQGFAPGKKAMKELKERVYDEMLPRAFSTRSTTYVWIDPVHGWLVVDAASPAKADDVIKMLLKAVDRMPLESLRVQRSPVGAMTSWLQDDEAPARFTVDMDATLRATGESKAAVVYKRHTLEPDEVRRHIAAGKQVKRLALTWDSKISLVLDESLAIKSIKPLDVMKESEAVTRNDDERFDGAFMLMTGELARMLDDLVEALGGEASDLASEAPARVKPAPRPALPLTPIERSIELTADLYKHRATYREVLGDLYHQTIDPYIAKVKERMAETGERALKCGIELANEQPATSGARQGFIVAAVEILAPTEGAAA